MMICSLSLHTVMLTTGNQCIKSFLPENKSLYPLRFHKKKKKKSDIARQTGLYIILSHHVFYFISPWLGSIKSMLKKKIVQNMYPYFLMLEHFC